jgi:hypothetical protein
MALIKKEKTVESGNHAETGHIPKNQIDSNLK